MLLQKIFPELLDLLTSFLAQQLNIMNEINWTSFGHWWVSGFVVFEVKLVVFDVETAPEADTEWGGAY